MTPAPLPDLVLVRAERVDRPPTETGMVWIKIAMPWGTQYLVVPPESVMAQHTR